MALKSLVLGNLVPLVSLSELSFEYFGFQICGFCFKLVGVVSGILVKVNLLGSLVYEFSF